MILSHSTTWFTLFRREGKEYRVRQGGIWWFWHYVLLILTWFVPLSAKFCLRRRKLCRAGMPNRLTGETPDLKSTKSSRKPPWSPSTWHFSYLNVSLRDLPCSSASSTPQRGRGRAASRSSWTAAPGPPSGRTSGSRDHSKKEDGHKKILQVRNAQKLLQGLSDNTRPDNYPLIMTVLRIPQWTSPPLSYYPICPVLINYFLLLITFKSEDFLKLWLCSNSHVGCSEPQTESGFG